MNNLELLKTGIENFNLEATDEKLQQLKKYREILVEWNKVMNLTGIEEEKEVYIKHFLDSISAVTNGYINNNISLIDVGTGAGFPGMPLKICLNDMKLTLLDSLNKRINFLQEVANELNLEGIKFIHGRAEDIARKKEYREMFDLSVSRAVANLASLSEYCIPFVKVNGFFVSYKSTDIEEETEKAGHAISVLGGTVKDKKKFMLPESDIGRSLVIIQKTKHTSGKYPRKAGLPSRMPL